MNNNISISLNLARPRINDNRTKKQEELAPSQREPATFHLDEILVNIPVGEEFVSKLSTRDKRSSASGRDRSLVAGVSEPRSPGSKTSAPEQVSLGIEVSSERIESSVNGGANFAPSLNYTFCASGTGNLQGPLFMTDGRDDELVTNQSTRGDEFPSSTSTRLSLVSGKFRQQVRECLQMDGVTAIDDKRVGKAAWVLYNPKRLFRPESVIDKEIVQSLGDSWKPMGENTYFIEQSGLRQELSFDERNRQTTTLKTIVNEDKGQSVEILSINILGEMHRKLDVG